MTSSFEEFKLKPVVFCGPSGAGKTTLLKYLMSEYPDFFANSVSHTTREPRQEEVDGKDYHFVTRDEIMKLIENNEFIEYAEYNKNIYGTSKISVEKVLNTGRICILVIDIEGVKSLKKSNLNPICIFMKTSSIDLLEKRLRKRGSETEESLKKRLETASVELDFENNERSTFDYVISTDDFEQAYKNLKEILSPQLDHIKKSLIKN